MGKIVLKASKQLGKQEVIESYSVAIYKVFRQATTQKSGTSETTGTCGTRKNCKVTSACYYFSFHFIV